MKLTPEALAFEALGRDLEQFLSKTADPVKLDEWEQKLNYAINYSFFENGWFTRASVLHALKNWAIGLKKENLESFLGPYFLEGGESKTIAVIMAGNIPLVGFHDFMVVLLSGNKIIAKLSSDDKKIIPVLAEKLVEHLPSLRERITFTPGMIKAMDALIATGSNNTSRYFEYYFGKYPHIIRKSRTSVAVLTGDESDDDLFRLGEDIFRYFGLGCRNVSKLMVPQGYDFARFFQAIFAFKDVAENKKYGNNYDYNRTIYLLNDEKLLDNGFMLLKEDKKLFSPVSVLFYETYGNEKQLAEVLEENKEQIQCIVGNQPGCVKFGEAQTPGLADYADGVDVMKFLMSISRG